MDEQLEKAKKVWMRLIPQALKDKIAVLVAYQRVEARLWREQRHVQNQLLELEGYRESGATPWWGSEYETDLNRHYKEIRDTRELLNVACAHYHDQAPDPKPTTFSDFLASLLHR